MVEFFRTYCMLDGALGQNFCKDFRGIANNPQSQAVVFVFGSNPEKLLGISHRAHRTLALIAHSLFSPILCCYELSAVSWPVAL